ncbi:MAG: YihY/virulence factor BrkB family protein [SAR324 cluster bacterium]|nr:YihY/virulence factor BrkB family protein [SAR324 cluster bacterium]
MLGRIDKFKITMETNPTGLAFLKFFRVMRLLADKLKKKNVASLSQSLAYTSILSLVPILAIFFSILGTITQNLAIQENIKEFISLYLIPEYVNGVFLQLQELSNKRMALGFIGGPALFLAGIMLYGKVDFSINEIWDTSGEKRWFKNSMAFFMTLFFGPMLLVLVFSIPPYLQTLPYYNDVINNPLVKAVITQLIPVLVSLVGLLVLYYYIPNTQVRLASAIWGSLFASVMIQISNTGLGFYFLKINTLGVIYGPLVTFPIVLLWIFALWLVVLSGAAIAFIHQNHSGTEFKFTQNLYNDESTLCNSLEVLTCLAQNFEKGEKALDTERLEFLLGMHKNRLAYILKRLAEGGFVSELLIEREGSTGLQAFQIAKSAKLIPLKGLVDLFYAEKKHSFFTPDQRDLFNRLAVHPIFRGENNSLDNIITNPKVLFLDSILPSPDVLIPDSLISDESL